MDATSLPAIQQSNMLTIAHKDKPIAGRCVINPALSIPASSLAPLTGTEPRGVRQNLYLATETHPLQVEVWVADVAQAGDPNEDGSVAPKITRLAFHAGGKLFVNLHRLGNQPCAIVAHSALENVSIVLPRNFVGALTTYSKLPLMTSIPREFNILSEMGGKGRYYRGSTRWSGTTLSVSAPKGWISIMFAKEPQPKVEKLITAAGANPNASSAPRGTSSRPGGKQGAQAPNAASTVASTSSARAPADEPSWIWIILAIYCIGCMFVMTFWLLLQLKRIIMSHPPRGY